MKAKMLYPALALLICLVLPNGVPGFETPEAGAVFPEIILPAPESPDHRAYLGLGGADTFTLSDIKGEIVIIEIFSMYCPHCQREAPTVNRLFRQIEEAENRKGRVKLIGIGAGNSAFEVDFFRKKYKIPFPLFADGKFETHKLIGEVRTPYFFGLKTGEDGKAVIFFSKLGGAKDAGKLLEDLMQQAGE